MSNDQRFPSLFISHGAPTLAIDGSAASRFLAGFGRTLGKPRGILMLSAHFESGVATVTSGTSPPTIYDFGGFPPVLYQMKYPAPGDPALAGRIAAMLEEAGMEVRQDPNRGFDHGAWVPLILMYPDADVPLVQLSISPARGTAWHLALGQLLAPLRDEGYLIIGSGSATHNLAYYFSHAPDAGTPEWAGEFNEWLCAAVTARDTEALIDYRARAPHAIRNHPTEEHYLPLLCAIGTAHAGETIRRVHESFAAAGLSMDTYQFGDA